MDARALSNVDPARTRSICLLGSSNQVHFLRLSRLDSLDRGATLRTLYDFDLSTGPSFTTASVREGLDLVEEGSTALRLETALQREWFRRLTISGAVTAAGFTALLAALGVLFQVKVLLVGAGIVGGVFLVALLALILARRGRIAARPHSSSPARASPTPSSSPICSRSRRPRWRSPRFSPSPPCFPTSTGDRCAGWSSGASCRRSRSPRCRACHRFTGVVPHTAQQVIAIAGLPAVTILTSLLLLQFSERIRRAREDETAAHVEAEQTRRALEQTSQRLRIALSAAGIGIWDLDPQSGMLSLDHRCASIFGLPAGGPLDYAGFLGLIVADDQPRVGAAIHRAVHGDGAARYELEFRIRDASGAAERWLRCTAQLLVDGMQVVG